MSNINIRRHAYTDFTGIPYIYTHGVPIRKYPVEYMHQQLPLQCVARTIIPDSQITRPWANRCRKDNMYHTYMRNNN